MKQIKHKGRLYVLKTDIIKEQKQDKELSLTEIQKLDFKPYTSVEKVKLNKALKKLLFEENLSSEQWALKQKKVCVMDRANVCMIIAKSSRAKQVLAKYVDIESTIKAPKLNYKGDLKQTSCKYSSDYMQKCTNFFACLNSATELIVFKLLFKEDYPLTALNDDWEFILAPRVDNE